MPLHDTSPSPSFSSRLPSATLNILSHLYLHTKTKLIQQLLLIMRVPDPDSSPDTSPGGSPSIDPTGLPRVASSISFGSIAIEDEFDMFHVSVACSSGKVMG